MIKDIISTIGTKILVVGLGFFNSIFFTRLLGVEGKGEMAIFIASFSFFILVFDFGLQTSIIYHGAKARINSSKLFNSIILYAILIGGGFFLILHIIQSLIETSFFLHKNRNSIFYEILLSLCVTFGIMGNQLKAIIISSKKFTFLNFLQFFIILFGVVLYASIYFDNGKKIAFSNDFLYLIYTLLIFLDLIFVTLYFLYNNKVYFLKEFVNWDELKKLFGFAGFAYGAAIAQFLNYRIDLWLVDYFSGVTQLGIYALAANLSQMIWLLPQSLGFVLLPYASSSEDSILERFLLVGRIVILVCLLLVVISLFTIDFLIVTLYGEAFGEASSSFVVLLFGSVPFCFFLIYASFFAGRNRVKVNMYASLIGLITTIILDFLLIPTFNALGASLASSISYLSTTLFLIYVLNKEFDASIKDMLLFQRRDFEFLKSLLFKLKHKKI